MHINAQKHPPHHIVTSFCRDKSRSVACILSDAVLTQPISNVRRNNAHAVSYSSSACSYGVVIYELATGKEPWEEMSPMQVSSPLPTAVQSGLLCIPERVNAFPWESL